MAQGDLNVANQSGAAFRADLNNQLAALGTLQSGASEPSTTFAYMLWADTTAALLKQRNAANNGWVTIGTLGSANLGLVPSTQTATTSAAGIVQLNDSTGSTSTTTAATPNAVKAAWDLADAAVPKAAGPLAGMRNLLINGNPTINQRGYVSGTATSGANQYTLDRWRVVTSGQSITWTDSANVRTVTAPAGGVEQVIEGINIFSGTYALNWTGTANATVNGVSVAKGGTVTLTGGTNCTVRFSGGTFSLPQLEPGTVATPFERRSYGQELALCQRYYETQTEETFLGFPCPSTGGFAHAFPIEFKVQKRAAPTIVYNLNNTSNVSTSNLIFANTFAWTLQVVGAGVTNTTASTNFSASAEL
jgi:hypothetical protein